ncbi:MAG: hypothetical protein INH13_25640 [Cupriavidus sp.]|nr:hypothetical protein [Cupriavidus sp.]
MIRVNIEKAKAVAHAIRRNARAAEFAPLDAAISLQIPGSRNAEVERQAVRDKYTAIQHEIDAAVSVEELKAVVDELKGAAE